MGPPQRLFLFLAFIGLPLLATQQTGTVRAADHFVPGATVTARQGDKSVVAFTDENGRYTLELAPGAWDLQVEMFGFTPASAQVTVGAQPGFKEWAIEMPRLGEIAEAPKATADSKKAEVTVPKPAAVASSTPATATPADSAQRRLRDRTGAPGGPGGPRPRPGIQNAEVRATQEGQRALAGAAETSPAEVASPEEADETFLVNGSTSGGLAASSDDEARRQRMSEGRGGPGQGGPGEPGGPNGLAGLGVPPGMAGSTADSLGLGGFGASAITAGFGGGAGGGPGFGADGGPGGPGGGGRGGGGAGGGGGGRGGGGGGGGGRGGGGGGNNNQRQRRGPNNGQFASFGNRRRSQPAYTGSAFITLNNSALNAAPFSLNGQSAPKASYDQARFGMNIGGPMVIPKIMNWQRASFYFTYQGSLSRNPYTQVSSVPTLAERTGDFSQAVANTPSDLRPAHQRAVPRQHHPALAHQPRRCGPA